MASPDLHPRPDVVRSCARGVLVLADICDRLNQLPVDILDDILESASGGTAHPRLRSEIMKATIPEKVKTVHFMGPPDEWSYEEIKLKNVSFDPYVVKVTYDKYKYPGFHSYYEYLLDPNLETARPHGDWRFKLSKLGRIRAAFKGFFRTGHWVTLPKP